MEVLSSYVEVLKKICEKGTPGKKAVQKLMYLIERKGVNLELEYSIHFFGPYSSVLDNVLHFLESNETIDINTDGRTHTINFIDGSQYPAGEFTEADREIIESVIDEFGDWSALELEGIATLDFVANSEEFKAEKDDSRIVEGVKRIKGTKFSDKQLYQYLGVLRDFGYLCERV